jgi:hypothetical protein
VKSSTALLAGPYTPPALRRGDRAFCLFQDTDVVITSFKHGRISWPRCRPIDAKRWRSSSILVNDELLRAIQTESSRAIHYWWGVSPTIIGKWRTAFGVNRRNNPGSIEGTHRACTASSGVTRGKRLSRQQVEERRERAIKLNLAQYMTPCPAPGGSRPWTRKEMRALGKAPDDEVAAKIGRTKEAVRGKRCQLGIPKYDSLRRRWAEAELVMLGTYDDEEVGKRLGRTVEAVRLKRSKLGIPQKRDRRRTK